MDNEDLQQRLTQQVRLYGRQHLATAQPARKASDEQMEALKEDIRGTLKRLTKSENEKASDEPTSHRDRLREQITRMREHEGRSQSF